jgi:hypothetical protein
LASQATTAASARATSSSANSRASSARLNPWSRATCPAIWFQCPGGVTVPLPSDQKRAIWVWSAVRAVLVALPRVLTSLKASPQAGLVRAGGPAGRNCDGLVMANGCKVAHCGSRAAMYMGAVGCHWPGAVPPA